MRDRSTAHVAAVLLTCSVLTVPSGETGRARLVGPASDPVVWADVPAPCARGVVDAMSLRQRAGQVLMVGVEASASGPPPDVTAALTRSWIGSVYLRGRSSRGRAATTDLVRAVRAVGDDRATGVDLHVAVDQEGGLVQVLRGPGFTDLPSALEQGRLPAGDLAALADGVGRELAAVGVTMNLAPVADVTPPGRDADAVGDLDRHYADDPEPAAAAVATVTRSFTAQGVTPVLKHFPGLGRADGNTDVDPDVRDTVTRPGDPWMEPFAAGVDAGAPVVMLSSALYTQIDDEALAVFSLDVIRTLRDDLGFRGVVMTDDLDRADAVAGIPDGLRAVAAITAGVDLVLVYGTGIARTMAAALVAQADADEAFAARLTDAAARVVTQKASAGLVAACPPAGDGPAADLSR